MTDRALGAAFAGRLLGEPSLSAMVPSGTMTQDAAMKLVDGLVLRCEEVARTPGLEHEWRFAREELERMLTKLDGSM